MTSLFAWLRTTNNIPATSTMAAEDWDFVDQKELEDDRSSINTTEPVKVSMNNEPKVVFPAAARSIAQASIIGIPQVMHTGIHPILARLKDQELKMRKLKTYQMHAKRS